MIRSNTLNALESRIILIETIYFFYLDKQSIQFKITEFYIFFIHKINSNMILLT